MSKLMSIVVLNWNRLRYTRQTVENIVVKTTVPHILTLVDNNSTEESGVRQYLSSITEKNTNATKVIHVFNGKNLGVSNGRNSGIYAVEQLGFAPEYIFNVDDDVLLPDNYDVAIRDACDNIPKLGITGVNVEPNKYPIISMNGINMQIKRAGNLGGAALALPRRVFKTIGYYGFGLGTLYAHEDSYIRYKLDMLGLISAYIQSRGIHLDNDADKSYRIAKNKAHEKGSLQLRELSKSVAEMRKTGIIYTPYTLPEQYRPIDEDIFTNDLITKDKIK